MASWVFMKNAAAKHALHGTSFQDWRLPFSASDTKQHEGCTEATQNMSTRTKPKTFHSGNWRSSQAPSQSPLFSRSAIVTQACHVSLQLLVLPTTCACVCRIELKTIKLGLCLRRHDGSNRPWYFVGLLISKSSPNQVSEAIPLLKQQWAVESTVLAQTGSDILTTMQ